MRPSSLARLVCDGAGNAAAVYVHSIGENITVVVVGVSTTNILTRGCIHCHCIIVYITLSPTTLGCNSATRSNRDWLTCSGVASVLLPCWWLSTETG